MIDILPDQRKQLQAVADILGDNLGNAWNYIGTLDALGAHAKLNRKLFVIHSHFISTVVYAIWDALFLKLHHCTDRHRRAYGFPKLFRLIRHYLPDDTGLLKQVTEDERSLRCGDATAKIEHWRMRWWLTTLTTNLHSDDSTNLIPARPMTSDRWFSTIRICLIAMPSTCLIWGSVPMIWRNMHDPLWMQSWRN